MNYQRKQSYLIEPYLKNLNQNDCVNNNTLNFIITKKSPIQQMNERIAHVTSEIKQKKFSKIKINHHHNLVHQLSPKNSYKSLLKYDSPKTTNTKFNYDSENIFQNMNVQKQKYFQKKQKTSPKVNFFYNTPKVQNKNSNFRPQRTENLKPIYHKAFESTDFILLSNSTPIQIKKSPKSQIHFNYINQKQKNNQNTKKNIKTQLSLLNGLNKENSQLQKQAGKKLIKRTRSSQNLGQSKLFSKKPLETRSIYKEKKDFEQQVFYDMKSHKKAQNKGKIIERKQKKKSDKEQPKNKLKIALTTRLSDQQPPSIFQRLFTQSINNQTKTIYGLLIILAISIFLLQFFS